MQSSALVQTRLVAAQQKVVVRPAPRSLRVSCAAGPGALEQSRRSTLALVASVFAAAAFSVGSAQAIDLPAQAASKRGGPGPSEASQSGYTMTGTKKRGLSPAERAAYLAKAKAQAIASKAKDIVS